MHIRRRGSEALMPMGSLETVAKVGGAGFAPLRYHLHQVVLQG